MQGHAKAIEEVLNDDLSSTLSSLQPRIKQILFHYRIPEHEAEDLVQEVLLTLVRRYDKVENLEAWLVCAISYQCRLYWRKYRKRLYQAVDESLLEVFSTPDSQVEDRYDQVLDARQALLRVPKRCRKILGLRYISGLTPKELAAKLGYRHSSISNLVRRCLASLCRKLLESPRKETSDNA